MERQALGHVHRPTPDVTTKRSTYRVISTLIFVQETFACCPPDTERMSSIGNLDISEFLLLVDKFIGSYYNEESNDREKPGYNKIT